MRECDELLVDPYARQLQQPAENEITLIPSLQTPAHKQVGNKRS